MHIEIAERLKPFSHLPGTRLMLPGTTYCLQVFPACLKIEDLLPKEPACMAQLQLNIQGPLDQFTVQQDLEKGCVRVWGRAKDGFVRYRVQALCGQSAGGGGVVIVVDKAPHQGIAFACEGKWVMDDAAPLLAGQARVLALPQEKPILSANYLVPPIDRLSLGNHKSQDWQKIRERLDFTEIFPIWHRLGQLIPKQLIPKQLIPAQEIQAPIGTLSLLDACKQAAIASRPETILQPVKALFLAGFESALSPRIQDLSFQGILKAQDCLPSTTASPLPLLSQGADLIRSLFVQWQDHTISLLPACPPQFHCGRLIHVTCGSLGLLSMEWTKKAVRSLSLMASSSQKISLSLHDGQRQCRVRQSYQDRGRVYDCGTLLEVTAGSNYWFDNFTS